MSKLDEKKARLDELRVYRNFALTSLLAVVGFVFTKMTELNLWFLGLCAFGVVLLGVGVIVLQRENTKDYQRNRGVVNGNISKWCYYIWLT